MSHEVRRDLGKNLDHPANVLFHPKQISLNLRTSMRTRTRYCLTYKLRQVPQIQNQFQNRLIQQELSNSLCLVANKS